MKPPKFVKEAFGIWTLAEDTGTTPHVERTGCLAWDHTFEICQNAIRKNFGTVIDVGAFIGDSTAWFTRWDIVTFEPQRDAYACLTHNIHLPWARHLPFPAGNGEMIDLQTNTADGDGNLGARRPMPGSQLQTIRIDDLELGDVVLIKIDAEGWEPNVLAGAVQTIIRCRPIMVVEFNGPSLAAAGFTFDHINQYFAGWHGTEIYRYDENQWDMLFTPL